MIEEGTMPSKNVQDDLLTWLLEEDDPSVRYWTLTRILGRGAKDAEVIEAKKAIMERGPAVEILARYARNGRWEDERNHYQLKYKSTHWQLLLLAELAADGREERIAGACRRMIGEMADEDGFTQLPCFLGNMVGYLFALGYGNDERVSKFCEKLARQGTDGEWRCKYNRDLPCAWGAARALFGFSKIPKFDWSNPVQDGIQAGVSFLSRYKLTEGNYPTSGTRHALWDRLSFPLFYQADVLLTLRALAELEELTGFPDYDDAMDWLASRRRSDGRWNGSSPYTSRMWTKLENSGRPSKWITWQVLYVARAELQCSS
jgi:hypothetical protein